MWQQGRSHHSQDIHLLHGAQLVAQHGRKRRCWLWAEAARARAARRGAAPCSATTRAPGETHASGTGTTGCETRHTGHRRSQIARRKASLASRGEWRGCYTPASAYSLWDSSYTSSVPGTRVSKHQRYVWWVHRSLLQASRVVYCVLPFVYLRSLAVDDGPTTRRTEDCQVAWKARRCRWRAAGAEGAGRRSARLHAASMPARATSPACPAARRTSACAGTAPPPPPRCNRLQRPRPRPRSRRTLYTRTRLQHTKVRRTVRYDKLPPRRVRGNLARCRRSRACRAQRVVSNRPKKGQIRSTKCPSWSNKGRLRSHRGHLRSCWVLFHPGLVRRAVRRQETFPLRAAPMGSSCLAPHNFAPNPQAIKVIAISYIELTERSDYTRFASVFVIA